MISSGFHIYILKMNPSQIARRIYKICEYLWNPWENKSQAAEEISHRQHREARILEYIKSVNICGICGRTISRCICENPWNLWENNLKMQRMAPTDIADEHGYRGRRSFPQIAQMNTDTGIYKICEICGICGRINLKQQRVAPTDIAD